ncbi:MAG TPA: IS110 family transposase [Candidatus Polarisedimenticolia bacterium]
MNDTTIAVDLAKSVFEVAVSEHEGHVSERHRLTRAQFLKFFAQRQPATILLEACGSSHHWGRQLQALGHSVRLLPVHAVRPYVPRNKTDRTDAKALLEAARNQEIHPVPLKSLSQQALMGLHRLRSGWLSTRTARINTVRGLLREFGFVIPVGSHLVVPRAQEIIENADAELPDTLRPVLDAACTEIRTLEDLIAGVERQLKEVARQTPVVTRLLTIPGVGLLTASVLVAFVGDVQRFPTARHFASYLGLTPRERSSGLARRLGAISKRGDTYIRMLLIHGARAVVCTARSLKNPDRLRGWVLKLDGARGHNKATVALANKMARIASPGRSGSTTPTSRGRRSRPPDIVPGKDIKSSPLAA